VVTIRHDGMCWRQRRDLCTIGTGLNMW